ncbi:MAG: spermidine synthase [Jatrophihabitantaceae bacterium]
MAATEADLTVGAAGSAELLADADRPGGWLLLVDRIRQSYVDLDDPTYLDFEYVQGFAEVLDALPPGPLAVTHVGGGACTLARYVAAVRPGSPQIVLEPDAALSALVRARLPFARRSRVRIRQVGGREGVAGLAAGSADVVVLDAFHGGRVPQELSTAEFFAEVAHVLRAPGLLLVNVADGGTATNKGVADRGGARVGSRGQPGGAGQPLQYTRRLVAAIRTALPAVLVRADPAVLKGRRFGNVLVVAARAALPEAELMRAAAAAMFPQRLLAGAELAAFARGATPLSDADPMRSPAPPDEIWR